MAADVAILFFCIVLTFFFSLLMGLSVISSSHLLPYMLINIAFTFLMLKISGAYDILWRYFNIRDYLACSVGVVAGQLLSSIVVLLLRWSVFPGFLLFNAILSLIGIVSFRLVFRRTFLILTDAGRVESRKRLLIVGAGSGCRLILEEIQRSRSDPEKTPPIPYDPICIVDDDPLKKNANIMGVRVEGTTAELAALCEKRKIDMILFAIPSCDETNRRRILDLCARTRLPVKIMPHLSQLFFQKDIIPQIQDVRIEDLLGRAPAQFDREKVASFLKGKVCMVTGGGGSIGSEIVRQIMTYQPKQVIIVDIYENNVYDIQQELYIEYGRKIPLSVEIASVRDYQKLLLLFEKYHPQIVFHAAAHKHVPLMESCPEEAVKNNVVGTFYLANLADSFGCEKFIMISTDKAVHPVNVMGATKRCCEMIIQYMSQHSTNTEFITTRFGNVLGSNGSVIPLFRKQIESGKAVTVTHPDMVRYFMTIPEAVSLVLHASAIAKGGEIFVLDMGAPVRILTLAENLISAYGKVPYRDVPIRFIGLRPGERLSEELMTKQEIGEGKTLQETENSCIFIGQQIAFDDTNFVPDLYALKDAALHNDKEETIRLLRKIVPDFHSDKECDT
jgi:FlaA1/EpsC-like NDP-sugar epimerase